MGIIIIDILLKLLRTPKLIYKKKLFKKYANFPHGMETVTFGHLAYCKNDTGNRDNITIGHHCDIHSRITASGDNSRISIGNYTTLRGGVVGAVEEVTIGDFVIISNNVTIYDNNNHPTNPEIRKKMCESGFYSDMWNWKYSVHNPVTIEDNVWVGEHVTILKGVTIGKGSIIASHSVVTKSVEPYTIVAGNPARKVKDLDFIL